MEKSSPFVFRLDYYKAKYRTHHDSLFVPVMSLLEAEPEAEAKLELKLDPKPVRPSPEPNPMLDAEPSPGVEAEPKVGAGRRLFGDLSLLEAPLPTIFSVQFHEPPSELAEAWSLT